MSPSLRLLGRRRIYAFCMTRVSLVSTTLKGLTRRFVQARKVETIVVGSLSFVVFYRAGVKLLFRFSQSHSVEPLNKMQSLSLVVPHCEGVNFYISFPGPQKVEVDFFLSVLVVVNVSCFEYVI